MTLLGLPLTQEAPRHDKFACVVAFVVGYQQGFAQKILAVTPRENLSQIAIFEQLLEGCAIFCQLCDGLIPSFSSGGAASFGQ